MTHLNKKISILDLYKLDCGNSENKIINTDFENDLSTTSNYNYKSCFLFENASHLVSNHGGNILKIWDINENKYVTRLGG